MLPGAHVDSSCVDAICCPGVLTCGSAFAIGGLDGFESAASDALLMLLAPLLLVMVLLLVPMLMLVM
jgi:hypothetical protein